MAVDEKGVVRRFEQPENESKMCCFRVNILLF